MDSSAARVISYVSVGRTDETFEGPCPQFDEVAEQQAADDLADLKPRRCRLGRAEGKGRLWRHAQLRRRPSAYTLAVEDLARNGGKVRTRASAAAAVV